MSVKLFEKYDRLLERFGLGPFRDISIFFVITFSLHGLWRWWGNSFGYLVFGKDVLAPLFDFLTYYVRTWSAWVSNHILGIETVIDGDILIHSTYQRLGVIFSCSGLKQFYQFAGLMLLFPGPWKKKLWFIPLGLFIIHLTNVFRIVTLYIIVIYKFSWFDFTHDWILRPLFYIVMFLLWVWWVEKLAKPSKIASNEEIVE